jgi:hypothetical protein
MIPCIALNDFNIQTTVLSVSIIYLMISANVSAGLFLVEMRAECDFFKRYLFIVLGFGRSSGVVRASTESFFLSSSAIPTKLYFCEHFLHSGMMMS